MNAAHEEAQRLLRLAARDQRAFEQLLKNLDLEDFPAAAFHAQQAVEKTFKAVLCQQGVAAQHTHDLQALAEQLAALGAPPPLSDEQLLRLTPYAVNFRYDDQALPLLTPDAARRIVAQCVAWGASRLAA